jgi:hypothetical protein
MNTDTPKSRTLSKVLVLQEQVALDHQNQEEHSRPAVGGYLEKLTIGTLKEKSQNM